MVMPAGALALSPEFEKAKADLRNAREDYAVLLEDYSLLTGVAGKNLEAEYMLKLGKKEHLLFSAQIELLRLKREIALFQAAANSGRTISAEDVRQIIEKEFDAYQKQLEARRTQLKEAEQHFAGPKLSPEETKRLKKSYHDLVRKLHPDLNPDLPEEASFIWDRVQDAYHFNDWDEILLLHDMADEMLHGKKDYVNSITSLDHLKMELKKITQKIADLEQLIANTKERVPYSYEKILMNPAEVTRKRNELDQEIAICNDYIKTLKDFLQEYIT